MHFASSVLVAASAVSALVPLIVLVLCCSFSVRSAARAQGKCQVKAQSESQVHTHSQMHHALHASRDPDVDMWPIPIPTHAHTETLTRRNTRQTSLSISKARTTVRHPALMMVGPFPFRSPPFLSCFFLHERAPPCAAGAVVLLPLLCSTEVRPLPRWPAISRSISRTSLSCLKQVAPRPT